MALTTYTVGEVLTAASLNDNFTFAAANPTSKIAQVVSATKTDTFTLASATYTDVTGLSVSITPSLATSTILVFAQVSGVGAYNAAVGFGQIVRDATAIGIGDASGSRIQCTFPIPYSQQAANNIMFAMPALFVDSPATTSATTYKIQVRSENSNTIYINRSEADSNSVAGTRPISTITVMEILA
jgi:hypothetical protein